MYAKIRAHNINIIATQKSKLRYDLFLTHQMYCFLSCSILILILNNIKFNINFNIQY